MTTHLPRFRRLRTLDFGWLAAGLAVAVGPGLVHRLRGSPEPDWIVVALPVAVLVIGLFVSRIRGLVLLALFSLFVDSIELSAGATIKYVDEVVIPLAAMLTVATRWREIRSRVEPARDAAIIVFVVAAFSSSLVARVPLQIWLPGLALVGKSVAIFYIALLERIHVADIRWASRLVLSIALVILVAGLVEVVWPGLFVALGVPPWAGRAGLPAINSLFYHPQLFGWLCGFTALYLFADHAVTRSRLSLALAIVFSMGTILSARRRAILAIVAGLGAGVVSGVAGDARAPRVLVRRWAPSIMSVAILGVIFLPALGGLFKLTVQSYLPPSSGLVGPGSPTVDATTGTPARLALLNGSIEIAQDYFPLGAGMGRYGSWISREHYSSLYHEYGLDRVPGLSPTYSAFITDTFWPQVLGETGVIGASAFLIFLAVIGVQLLSAIRRPGGKSGMEPFMLGTLLVFGQTLVESLASPIFNSPSQAYLVMLAVGAALSWSAWPAEDVAPGYSAL